MAANSLPLDDVFDDMAALRGQLRRQAQQIASLQTTVAGLTATMANVMARLFPIGTMVLDEQEEPAWLEEPADSEPPLEPQPVFIPAEVASGAH
jgi:hypothetical protein